MAKKYINRNNSFRRSLRILSDSCGADSNATFVLSATAQAFNLTFDLSWKVMKNIIIEHFGFRISPPALPEKLFEQHLASGLFLMIDG